MKRCRSLLGLGILSLLALALSACAFSQAGPVPASPDTPPPTLIATRVPAVTLTSLPPSAAETWLTEVNAGQRVQVSSGQVLGINLEANPSTGYSWEVSTTNPGILQQTGEPEFKSDSTLVGAPARQLIRFKVIAPGECKLELIYHRPWEKGTPPERSFSVNVTAQ